MVFSVLPIPVSNQALVVNFVFQVTDIADWAIALGDVFYFG